MSVIMHRSLRYRQKMIQQLHKSGDISQKVKEKVAILDRKVQGQKVTLINPNKPLAAFSRSKDLSATAKTASQELKKDPSRQKYSSNQSQLQGLEQDQVTSNLNQSIRVTNLKDLQSKE